MINRREFMLGTAACSAAAITPFQAWSQLKKDYPNVLMIIVDDLNDWVGAMGGHPNAKTPNIDKLASKGTLFTNAHAPAPLCGPSRASIMSGLAPSTTGIYGHIRDNDIRKVNDKTAHSTFLSEYFKKHGYYTAAVGKVFHEAIADGSFDIDDLVAEYSYKLSNPHLLVYRKTKLFPDNDTTSGNGVWFNISKQQRINKFSQHPPD